ncbi:MAG: hypothetical protein HEQ16_08730 [Bosea sp.]|jgi:hypothetical protein|nr:hypothetical protein [Bosea sp. (in: a-proteobacteria)]
MTTYAPLKTITLHLARTREHPDGSTRHGYQLTAPLGQDGRIDAEAWKHHRNGCIVHRFWGDEPRQRGVLVHRAGGAAGAHWSFDYDRSTDNDDEDGYRLADHVFAPGEYVSIRDADDELHTFRVVSVEPF